MGHWSERLLADAARATGLDPETDRDRLIPALEDAGREIEVLAGRQLGVTERRSVRFLPQPFPFVEIPDLQVGSMELNEGTAWTVPDPVNQQMSTVIQTGELEAPKSTMPPSSVGDALWVAGNLAAQARRGGLLSADYVLRWLGTAIPEGLRMRILRDVVDDDTRFNVPVLGVGIPGWWIQITRRLFWVTSKTPDEGRLLEPLFDPETLTDKRIASLAAGEPVLILARVASHPADWALTARIWTEDVKVADRRPWRILADAIHGSGIPIMTIDAASRDEEVGCQLLLLALWHRYIDADEDGLSEALARAYPGPVGRIRAKTGSPNLHAAAAMLLRRLLRPGFDPAKGAAATRRYVNRLASIVVMEHRKATLPAGTWPWQRLGIKERHYYKLLRRAGVPKVAGRYAVDDELLEALRKYLDWKDEPSARQLAKSVLLEHGFSDAAARKWLQRHQPEEAVSAWPRSRGMT